MLNLTNVVYQHGGKTLVDLDQLTVPAGQFHALLGPNGAGKTTLLRCISGDLQACGTVQLYGRALGHWPDRERAHHLAVLPQSSQLTFAFTASEVVALGLIPLTLDRATATRQVEETMTLTGCEHLARRPWPALSGGERQRVQLARVRLQLSQAERPPLLLLSATSTACCNWPATCAIGAAWRCWRCCTISIRRCVTATNAICFIRDAAYSPARRRVRSPKPWWNATGSTGPSG